jgi:capsular exopolysaccharide synthesis family protein
VGGVIALIAAKTATKEYSSSASLLFQEDGLSQQLFGYATSSAVDPTTQDATDLELVTQPVVAVATAKALGTSSKLVASEISAAEAGSTDIVSVTATSPSPAFAEKLVNEYTEQFIKYRQSADQAQVVQAAGELRQQVARLKAAGAASDQIANLETRLSQLEVLASIQTGDVQLAQLGQKPTVPSSPKTKRDVGLGLIVGLIAGLIAAVLAERLDQRVRASDDLAAVFGLPVLGSIPRIRALVRPTSKSTAQAVAESETFRRLRVQLRYFNVDNQITSVLVTSAQPGDGKSTIAWHLAREAALMNPGAPVLLVDADLRRPSIARIAGVRAAPGVAELASGEAQLEDVLQRVAVTSPSGDHAATLYVITSGALAPNPYELLASSKLKSLLVGLEEHNALVVIDTPPTSVASDAVPLTREVSGVLVVVRSGRTMRRSVTALLEQLNQVQARVLGVVLNDVTLARSEYDSYYSYTPAPVPKTEPEGT